MKNILLLTPVFCLLFTFPLAGQLTDPTVVDLSAGASFSLNSYTGNTFPTNVAIGFEDIGTNGNFVTPLILDAPHGTANGKWNDEADSTVSYRGSGTAERGCFLMALNTTDRMNVKVGWKVFNITTGSSINFIELQYRVGNTGNFSNVNNDLFQDGVTPTGTSFQKTLPAATDNQPLVYVRWIYYETGNGSRARLAVDNISFTSVVLPIELSRFDAQAQGATVNLAWETATEINNARFVIERSANGRDFRALESLAGAGNSFTPQTYRFTDHQPLPGRSYYRLQQVDFDGHFTFSPVRQVTVDGAGSMRIWPTPALSTLTAAISTAFRDNVRWAILDAAGHSLHAGVWPAETTELTLEVADLQPGQYLFRVGDFTQRFVKQ